MFSRRDGRRFRPTPAAYTDVAPGYAKPTKTDPAFLAIGEAPVVKRPPTAGESPRLAVRPAWITGYKRPPCPVPGVVLFPFEEVHVVAQEDE